MQRLNPKDAREMANENERRGVTAACVEIPVLAESLREPLFLVVFRCSPGLVALKGLHPPEEVERNCFRCP